MQARDLGRGTQEKPDPEALARGREQFADLLLTEQVIAENPPETDALRVFRAVSRDQALREAPPAVDIGVDWLGIYQRLEDTGGDEIDLQLALDDPTLERSAAAYAHAQDAQSSPTRRPRPERPSRTGSSRCPTGR